MSLATRFSLLAVLAATCLLAVTSSALATVRVSKAELNGTQLRIEGTATANRQITVDGVAMTSSDGAGNFKLQRDSFARPADCRVAVNDGSATATTATLSGCSVSTTPSPSPTPAPSTSAALSSVKVSPTAVVGGTPVTGTVTLTAAAPTGGFTVALSSDDPAAATVPASVTVPAGATTATFPGTTFLGPKPPAPLILGTA